MSARLRRHIGDDICPREGAPVTEEHLTNALVFMAYVVTAYGEKYMPIFERIKREVDEMRRCRSPMQRVRRIMEARTIDVSASGPSALPRDAG